MLTQLKNLNFEHQDVEELVEYSLCARGLHAEFEALGIEVPEWLDNRTRELRRQIRVRLEDATSARLRELKSRREALKPTSEKRTDIEAEIKRLEELAAK